MLVGGGQNNSSALRLLACDFCCLAAAAVGFQFSLSGPFPWPCVGHNLDASHGPALSPRLCSCLCLCAQLGGMRSRSRARPCSCSACAQPVNLAPLAPVPAVCTCRSLGCVRRWWRWWGASFLRGNGSSVGVVAVGWGCRCLQLRMRAQFFCSLAAATLGPCSHMHAAVHVGPWADPRSSCRVRPTLARKNVTASFFKKMRRRLICC